MVLFTLFIKLLENLKLQMWLLYFYWTILGQTTDVLKQETICWQGELLGPFFPQRNDVTQVSKSPKTVGNGPLAPIAPEMLTVLVTTMEHLIKIVSLGEKLSLIVVQDTITHVPESGVFWQGSYRHRQVHVCGHAFVCQTQPEE